MRKSANGPQVRIRATIVSGQRNTMGSLLCSPLLPRSATARARRFQRDYLVHVLSCLIPLLHLSYVKLGSPSPIRLSFRISLAESRSHSRTTLAHLQSSIGSTHSVYGEADYAPISAYRLLSFPWPTLADIISLLFDTFHSYDL